MSQSRAEYVLYATNPEFKSRIAYGPYWLLLMVFLSPPMQMQWKHVKLDSGHFFPHPFQFAVYLSIIRRYTDWATDSVTKYTMNNT